MALAYSQPSVLRAFDSEFFWIYRTEKNGKGKNRGGPLKHTASKGSHLFHLLDLNISPLE